MLCRLTATMRRYLLFIRAKNGKTRLPVYSISLIGHQVTMLARGYMIVFSLSNLLNTLLFTLCISFPLLMRVSSNTEATCTTIPIVVRHPLLVSSHIFLQSYRLSSSAPCPFHSYLIQDARGTSLFSASQLALTHT